MPYVYSTLTCGNVFPVYAPKNDPRDLSRIVHKIEIKGGHGIKKQKEIYTPMGVRTEVSESDLELLLKNKSFQMQVKAGYITVDNKKVVAEKRAADMNPKDASAPLTPKDFEKGDLSDDEITTYKKKGKK